MDSEFNTYDRMSLEQLQKELIFRKGHANRGGEAQREFLHSLVENEDQWIKGFEDLHVSTKDLTPCPTPSEQMSEREFLNPPFSTEREIANLLKELPRRQASQPEFWTHYTIEMIKQGRISTTFLAARRDVPTQSGRDRIDAVLKGQDGTEIDSCVRSVFRNLGGIYSDRAKRTTYLDCPTSRAWWRHNFAWECYSCPTWNLDLEQISNTLRGGVWEELVQSIVSRMTVIGASNIRNVLIHHIVETEQSRQGFKAIVDAVGKRCTVQMLAVLPISELQQILRSELAPKTS